MAKLLNDLPAKRTLAAETPKKINQLVLLKGRLVARRDHGKIVFFDLRDRSAIIQIVTSQKIELNHEDAIEVIGKVVRRPSNMINKNLATGEIEVQAIKIRILAKAANLPFDMGSPSLKVDLPTLLDYRALTLRHPKIQAIFKVQATIVQAFRETMQAMGFVEFQAPTIVATATEGGAEIFPVKYYAYQTYLAQSPQFYKQIMASVFERVFTVAHAYRAEPSVTTRHLSEYVGLDVEMAFIDSWQEIIDTADYLIKNIFKAVALKNKEELAMYKVLLPKTTKKTPQIKLKEAQEIIYERTRRDIRKEPDLDPEGEKEIGRWAKEKYGSDLIFITHYPTKKRPMYTHPDPKNPAYTLSFDLIGCGQEWITGSQRINDYQQLVRNIRKWGCEPKNFEIPYLQAFKYGMPPEGGFCLGLERITMNILQLKNIREASLFPRDMERVDVRLSRQITKNRRA